MNIQPILILTHSTWGKKLIESTKMIIGDIDNIHAVPLFAEDSLSDYLERVTQTIETLEWNKKLLILTDMKGGTPSNVALRLSKNYEVVIISGLCSSMLLEAVMRQNENGFTNEMAEEIKNIAISGCQVLEIS